MISIFLFFFNYTVPTEIYTLSLHDALPILVVVPYLVSRSPEAFYELLVKEQVTVLNQTRSEEHTSELQSQSNLVCRLLLEKKKSSTVTDRVYSVSLFVKHVSENGVPLTVLI